jgi:hypothetical protein
MGFSNFKAKYEVLLSFNNLEELFVLQKVCPINDNHDIFKVKID